MEKIKRHLAQAEANLRQNKTRQAEHEEKTAALCDDILTWLLAVPPSVKQWELSGQERLLHLHLLGDDSVILRVTPQWHKNPNALHITLQLFEATRSKVRTVFELTWQPKSASWQITRFKRYNHWFRTYFYRRKFNQKILEHALLDFFTPPE